MKGIASRDVLLEYERRKRALERLPLTPQQYEAAILKISRELGL